MCYIEVLKGNKYRILVLYCESEQCISLWALNSQGRSVKKCNDDSTSPIHSGHTLVGILPFLQFNRIYRIREGNGL